MLAAAQGRLNEDELSREACGPVPPPVVLYALVEDVAQYKSKPSITDNI